MPRPRTIPDDAVYAEVLRLLAQGGDKAVSFASVARASGLAAPSLVQRYGARDAMLRTALTAAWDALDRQTEAAIAASDSPLALLKALGSSPTDLSRLAAGLRDATLRARAGSWRAGIELELTRLMGGGHKARDDAQVLFVAWQGRLLWQDTGSKAIRLKDLVKRLG